MLRTCSERASPTPRTLRYSAARRKIRHGDLLLFPHRGLPGRLIAAAGRSPYSHAALAAWWQGRLMVLEVRQFRGGRAVLLSNVLRRGPIDVFAADAEGLGFNRRRAVGHMLGYTGRACRGSLRRGGPMRHRRPARRSPRPDVPRAVGPRRSRAWSSSCCPASCASFRRRPMVEALSCAQQR